MISLDTNMLVRYLEQDDPQQAKVADRIINSSLSRGEDVLITDIVVCELVWVLDTCYHNTRDEMFAVLEKLFRTAQFVYEDKAILWGAWEDYRAGKGDFSDYLIGRAAKQAGAVTTHTFDKSLKHSPLFTVA